jgi:hypothetical protein
VYDLETPTRTVIHGNQWQSDPSRHRMIARIAAT